MNDPANNSAYIPGGKRKPKVKRKVKRVQKNTKQPIKKAKGVGTLSGGE